MTPRKGRTPLDPPGTGQAAAGEDGEGKFIVGVPPGWEQSPISGLSGVVAWTWVVRSKEVVYSREWCNLLGRPDNGGTQADRSVWWAAVHEDDMQSFLEASREIVEGRTEVYQSLFRVRREDGKWVWLLSYGRVAEKDEHGPVLVHGAIMDVSLLRHNVKFLHGCAETFPSLLHTLPFGEPAGSGRELHRPKADAPGAGPSSVGTHVFSGPEDVPLGDMDPARRAQVQEYVRQVFTDGIALQEVVTFTTDCGDNVTGEYSIWPVLDAKGAVTAVVTQFRDLTDQILAERRARLNEMRLDALYSLTQMSGAPEDEVMAFAVERLVELTESKSGFLFFPHNNSERKGRMVWSQDRDGVNREALSGDSLPSELAELATSDDGRRCQRVMRNGNYLQPVKVLFEGSMPIMRYIAVPFFEEDRLVCLAAVFNKEKTVYRDDDLAQLEAFVNGAWLVLRRHEHIRELQRAKDAAELASKVKDEFLANVSHELRTPLNGILGMLQLLDLLPLNDQQREYVNTASSSGRALLRIISDILDFARIESKKMQLQNEPFDFKKAFESSLDLFRSEAGKKGLAFASVIDENIPSRLLGDDARVRQILFNLVGNALKFTDRGGIRVECSLLPHSDAGHVRIYLAVSDSGIGIPFEEQTKIFDAFTQIDSSPTRKYQGTGLGLGIVRQLLRLMHGSMTIESEGGGGTVIHCSLRFAVPPRTAAEAEPAEEIRVVAAGEPLHILVAEDDAVSRFAIQKFFQNLGQVSVCVPNGRVALEMLQLHKFHCLFTDIQMPEMDGLETVRRIRENRFEGITPSAEAREILQAAFPGEYTTVMPVPRDTITVAISAHSMKGDKERFLNAGMDFYISKPVIVKELSDVLRMITNRLAFMEP